MVSSRVEAHGMYSSVSTQLWPSAQPPSPLSHYSQFFKGPLNMPQVAACHWVFNSKSCLFWQSITMGIEYAGSICQMAAMRIWGCCLDISAQLWFCQYCNFSSSFQRWLESSIRARWALGLISRHIRKGTTAECLINIRIAGPADLQWPLQPCSLDKRVRWIPPIQREAESSFSSDVTNLSGNVSSFLCVMQAGIGHDSKMDILVQLSVLG